MFCKDQQFLATELIPYLSPIQMGEREPEKYKPYFYMEIVKELDGMNVVKQYADETKEQGVSVYGDIYLSKEEAVMEHPHTPILEGYGLIDKQTNFAPPNAPDWFYEVQDAVNYVNQLQEDTKPSDEEQPFLKEYIISVDTMFSVRASSEEEARDLAGDTLKNMIAEDCIQYVVEEEYEDEMKKNDYLTDYEMQQWLENKGRVLYNKEIDNNVDMDELYKLAVRYGFTWNEESESWRYIRTQTDEMQWVNQMGYAKFFVIDITADHDEGFYVKQVEVNLPSEQEMEKEISGYYSSLEEVKRESWENWHQIVAEIIAENEPVDNQTPLCKTKTELKNHLFKEYGIRLG